MSETQVNIKEKIKEEFFKCSQDPVYFMRKYYMIVNTALRENRKKSKDIYYENHHIIPKCMGGKDSCDNLVLLTAEEHFLCHYLLYKSYPNNKKLFYCVHKMLSENNKQERFYPNYKIIEEIKKEHAKWVSDYFSIPVDEYTIEGKFVKTWDSALCVEKSLGIYHGNIGLVIKGKRKTAGGRIWKLKGDILLEQQIQIAKNTKNTKTPISIIQYDPVTNKELHKYNSSYEASKFLGVANSNILKVCKGQINHTKGLYFRYE